MLTLQAFAKESITTGEVTMSHYKLMINRHEHTAVRGDRAPSREIIRPAGSALNAFQRNI